MNIKPIKTESDYQANLQDIDALMHAQPDTPEGDELDVLVTLVEAYESRIFSPQESQHPHSSQHGKIHFAIDQMAP
jgi:HTH-type transcriptional regulator/antitoxin HigA